MESRLKAMGAKHLRAPIVDLKDMQERLARAQKIHTLNIAGKLTPQSKQIAANSTPLTPPAKTSATGEESSKKKIPKRKSTTNRARGRTSTSIPPISTSEESDQNGKGASEVLIMLQVGWIPHNL